MNALDGARRLGADAPATEGPREALLLPALAESTIIESLEDHHGASGTRLIPEGSKDLARQTRYLRMLHPFEQHEHLMAYSKRLSERPSFARVLKEVAPFMARMAG